MTDFWSKYGAKLIQAIIIHFQYVFVSVAIGSVIAIVLGVFLTRVPKLSKFVMPIIGVFQTIPGIVFIGILFIYLGMEPITVIIALSIYAIFPVLKNTYAGILDVDDFYIEAARGCGMSDWGILFRVELPMAVHSIIGGIRMSTVYTVSWAVLAAMIGQGGLGDFIYTGIDSNVQLYIVIGAVPAAIMAILLGFLIDKIQYYASPKYMRRRG